jgi:pimeloyl-ACP methyl ester carboxylesterase
MQNRMAARSTLASVLMLLAMSTYSGTTMAEDEDDIHGALVLKEQGMFYVGGDVVHTDWATGPHPLIPVSRSGDIAINQMYVTFMVPRVQRGVPIILMHGGNLSGACYETTPDGRMGWYEFFARKGHAVYLPDQVSRARSGFDVTPFNEVAAGVRPPSAVPNLLMVTKAATWQVFRFGPSLGTAFPDEQFPVEAIDELAKQSIPDQNADQQQPPGINLTPTRLAELGVKIGGAVLVGHSEAGFYPELAALQNTAGLRGLISLEPAGSCAAKTLSKEQIAKLAQFPTLVVFGDHLADVSVPGLVNWPAALADCQQYVTEINQAGGHATLLHLPAAGVIGNSHMMFQDKNNLQVGDMILAWIHEHVEEK